MRFVLLDKVVSYVIDRFRVALIVLIVSVKARFSPVQSVTMCIEPSVVLCAEIVYV